MITIGIDPGLTGAIGVLSDGHYVAVEDMPVILKGKGKVKNEVDVAGVIRFLRQYGEPSEYISCVLERVNARPNQGVSTIFSLGDSFGCARSAITACRFELRYVTPQVWKKHFKLSSINFFPFTTSRFTPYCQLSLKTSFFHLFFYDINL